MKSKDSILIKFLIENKNEELNIRNISKGLRMDYKNAYSIIKRLEKDGMVKLETFCKSNRVKLIQKLNPLIFEAEYRRREEFLKDKNLAVMLKEIKQKVKSTLYVLLLFGSYAKKTQTKNSDIDLIFIVPDGKEESFEKDTDKIIRLLPLPIHHLVFSEKQFLEMVNSRESNVGKEALNNNIILYGTDAYYEMI
jgi:predicted nucleotidyltransferase